jgi:hypothetical protein
MSGMRGRPRQQAQLLTSKPPLPPLPTPPPPPTLLPRPPNTGAIPTITATPVVATDRVVFLADFPRPNLPWLLRWLNAEALRYLLHQIPSVKQYPDAYNNHYLKMAAMPVTDPEHLPEVCPTSSR